MRTVSNEALLELLGQIADGSGGILRPEDVVSTASDESHPLHDHFTWDDGRAAHLYRIDEARRLIRVAHVTMATDKGQRVIVPAYLRKPDAESREQGYISIASIVPKSEMAEASLSLEAGRTVGNLERLRAIACLLGVEPELDAVVLSAKHLQVRASLEEAKPQ